MHEHIRDIKEIPIDVKPLTLQIFYAEIYKCHLMIGGQQW